MGRKSIEEELTNGFRNLEENDRQRMATENKLKECEEKFRIVADQSLFGLSILQNGKYIYMNETACRIVGYSHDEVIQWEPKDFLRLIHPDDISLVMYEVQKKLRYCSDAVSHYYYRLYDKEGTLKWIENYSKATEYKGERADLIIFADITERKLIESALRESEEKYRRLVENANEAIFISQDGSIKFPNPKTEQLLGYSSDELTKISMISLVHPDDREMVEERHQRRISGENPPDTYSFRIVNRHNEDLWVEINAVLIQWEGRPAILNLLRDVTDQRILQAQLQQAKRMEALGTLSGGIAHDFNNLLMGIQGYTSLLIKDTDPLHPHYQCFKEIEDIVHSAAELTRQLLGFARSGKYEVKPTDINKLLKNSMRMFSRTKKEIHIQQKLPSSIQTVDVDQSQIEQVVMNLCVNACDAMEAGGTLTIQTENVHLNEDETQPFKVPPGKYVMITVADNGIGMDEKTQQRIFDPFFTTKEKGRGTGLGLASAYGIIKNHKGFIRVESERHKGSTFYVHLPASDKPSFEEVISLKNACKGSETILLVEDEEMILTVGTMLLESLGYQPLTAKSGKEAIKIYAENMDIIDLVILDMIIPDMGGGEIFDRLKKLNPSIKVLVSSGYSIDGQAEEILQRGGRGFIQKPFGIEQLSAKIREII